MKIMTNWIKCSDRLPDFDKEVLVVMNKEYTLGGVTMAIMLEKIGWWKGGYGIYPPTHWAELPEPPSD